MNERLSICNICKCDIGITLEWSEVLLLIAPRFDAIFVEGLYDEDIGKRVATWWDVSYCPVDLKFCICIWIWICMGGRVHAAAVGSGTSHLSKLD